MVLTIFSKRIFTWVLDTARAVAAIFRQLRSDTSLDASSSTSAADASKAPLTAPEQVGERFVQNLCRLEAYYARHNIQVEYHVSGIWPEE